MCIVVVIFDVSCDFFNEYEMRERLLVVFNISLVMRMMYGWMVLFEEEC